MAVPAALRERVFKSISRQRSVTIPAVLMELVDAVIERRVNTRADVHAFITGRGHDVTAQWITTQCKHLQELWTFVNPGGVTSTAIVAAETVLVEAVATELPPPPPPPASMVTLSMAMRDLIYRGRRLPMVNMSPHQHKYSHFDRNDLYRTNMDAMHELLRVGGLSRAERVLDKSLMFVALSTGEGRGMKQYITWCQRGELRDFAARVNSRAVRCNDMVTRAIDKNARFRCDAVCDDVGFLRMTDLDDVLYMLERYHDEYGTRHPAGLNAAEVPHLMHRSLYMMGGNKAALDAYEKWELSVSGTTGHVTSVLAHVELAKKALAAMDELRHDLDMTEALCVKWEQHCVDAAESLALAKREFTRSVLNRKTLKARIVSALADAVVMQFHTALLVQIREDLQSPEPNQLAGIDAQVAELTTLSGHQSVRKALIQLEIWDGADHMPAFDREKVNSAYRGLVRKIHPDTNTNASDLALSEPYQLARDNLHAYLEKRG